MTSLYIFFNKKPTPLGIHVDDIDMSTLLDFSHNHLFEGYLELDGAGVGAQTKVWDVAQLASGDYTYHCIRELRDCSIDPAKRIYSMGFNTDDAL